MRSWGTVTWPKPNFDASLGSQFNGNGKEAAVIQRQLRQLTALLLTAVGACGLMSADQLLAEVRFFGKKPATSPTPPNPNTAAVPTDSGDVQTGVNAAPAVPRAGQKKIKLNYFGKSWDDVVKDVAKQSNLTTMIDKVPPGRFSRNDWNSYTLSEALRILNRELEPKGFRLLERGQILDLVFLRDSRQDYPRPVIDVAQTSRQQESPNVAAGNSVDEDASPRRMNSTTSKRKTPNTKTESARDDRAVTQVSNRSNGLRQKGAVQQASFEDTQDDNDDDDELDLDDEQPATKTVVPPAPARNQKVRAAKTHWVEVPLTHQPARKVSRLLYQAFLESAELVEQGPNGLAGFVVWDDSQPKRARFTIGVDSDKDVLVVDGSPTAIGGVRKLIAKLDVAATKNDRSVRMIASNHNVREVAQALRPAVKQLAEQAKEEEDANSDADAKPAKVPLKKGTAKAKPTQKPAASKAKETKKPSKPAMSDDDAEMPKPKDKEDSPAMVGGLRGDVSVEALDDLGVLIIRGNEADVEAVMNIIKQIEKLSAGSSPDIHVRALQHVDSESLAELLTSVYERLNRSRGREREVTQQISVIAIGKPNAVMVLASQNDIETVDALIDKLDQPIDPTNEFEVFRLRHAVASQVLTAIDNFFGSGSSTGGGGGGQTQGQGTSTLRAAGGLRGRVKSIADSRTNSVIVQAKPRDLEEVRRLVEELDQVGSSAVNKIRLIPLKNALAEEIAELLNLAIQSAISPPTQTRAGQTGGGGAGGALGGGGGQGQVDQKLREAKSAVLQYLESDANGENMIESGVLSDIRINADPRTNSLIVTAPEESLALVEALVRRFDKPSAMVAEIKHFMLRNADASSVVKMLNELFSQSQQGQGQGQRAGGNQLQQQLGLQLAGAEDASSQLIPLKFSTDIRTNSIIAVGGAEALSVVEAIILRLDASDVRQRQSSVYRLKNSPAQEVGNAITLFLQGQRDLANTGNQDLISDVEQLDRQVIVVAEPNSNSLLISATPRYFKDIMEMVTRIDAAKQEVVIQALLVEVTLDNLDEFGIELGFQDSLLFNRSLSAASDITTITTTTPATPTQAAISQQTIVSQAGSPGFLFNNLLAPLGNNIGAKGSDPNAVGTQGLSNFNVGRTSSNAGFGGLVLSAGSESVNVLLRALSANRKLEILSRPQIRTLDSQTGTINVGQIVPVVNGITASGAVGNIVPQILRDPAGIILEVTPRITPDDRIVMLVHAERSNYNLASNAGVTLTTDAAGREIKSPIKDISTAITTISVANEQTIVVGGLIQKTNDAQTRKVPWLGDVPILGNLFRFDSLITKRTELLIFLTPRIVKNNSVSEIIKQIEAERLHYTEEEAEAMHGPLFCAPAASLQTPSDGAAPPVYAPGELWLPPSPKDSAPPPPLPPGTTSSSTPRVLPISDNSTQSVQSVGYQRTNNSATNPQVPARKAKSTKKTATVLDTFHREKSGAGN